MYICLFWMVSVKRQVNSQRKAQNDDFYFVFFPSTFCCKRNFHKIIFRVSLVWLALDNCIVLQDNKKILEISLQHNRTCRRKRFRRFYFQLSVEVNNKGQDFTKTANKGFSVMFWFFFTSKCRKSCNKSNFCSNFTFINPYKMHCVLKFLKKSR